MVRRLIPAVLLLASTAALADTPLPSVDDPPNLAMGQKQDFAVVVGIPSYPFISKPVAYAEQDARAMVRFLEESRGLDPSRIRLVLQNDASKERILEVLAEAGRVTGKDGVVWLYFAGHGSAHPDTGERILLPVDAQETTLSFRAKGLGVDDAVKEASAGGARVVVIADACYTGVGKGRFSVDVNWLPPQAAVAELTATKQGEVAMPLDPAKHGAFTFAMLGAMRGWADGAGGAPKDGVVTMAEATTYTTQALDAMGFDTQDPYPAYSGGMTDQFALIKKGAGPFEAPPPLPRLVGSEPVRVQSGSSATLPKPTIAVVGGSATSMSDLDKQLVEQECEAEKVKVAEATAMSEEATAVTAQQTAMRATWKGLQEREAATLRLPTVAARGPMIAAVEKFLADARGLKVTRTAGSVTVPVKLRPSAFVGKDVDCGTRSVALPARTTAVSVPEVADAEAMLTRLKAPPSSAPAPVATPQPVQTPAPKPVAAPVTTGRATGVAGQIQALTTSSSAWDAQVLQILVGAYDRNSSGALDTPSEVALVTCEAWSAVDAGVRNEWGGTGVGTIYGFDPNLIWVGGSLGFGESVRPNAWAALQRCGVASATASAPVSPATAIASFDPASDAWDTDVRGVLIAAFDGSGSKALEAGEVSSIDCETWSVMDTAVRARWSGNGVGTIYGFDPNLIWVGYAFGIDESARSTAWSAVQRCGLASAAPAGPASAISAVDPGDSTWDEQIRGLLIGAYDQDGDRALDSDEVRTIGCEEWQAMDAAVRSNWGGSGLTTIYGLAPSMIWVGYALGIDESARAQAFSSAEQCGI